MRRAQIGCGAAKKTLFRQRNEPGERVTLHELKTMYMERLIKEKLQRMAKAEGVTILYACESGSRGWLMPSPDSDYDVRFIYVRPYAFYLSLHEQEDHLGFAISDELDIHGWDIRKVLRLAGRSNATPFEWLQSPVVYMEDSRFRETIWAACIPCFNQRKHVFHYLGIARGAWENLTSAKELTIKKLFYVLRPLLAALWCAQKNSIAPITVTSLVQLMPAQLKEVVERYLRLKAVSPESHLVQVPAQLKAYIESTFAYCYETAATLPKTSGSDAALTDYFIKTISHYDHR